MLNSQVEQDSGSFKNKWGESVCFAVPSVHGQTSLIRAKKNIDPISKYSVKSDKPLGSRVWTKHQRQTLAVTTIPQIHKCISNSQ